MDKYITSFLSVYVLKNRNKIITNLSACSFTNQNLLKLIFLLSTFLLLSNFSFAQKKKKQIVVKKYVKAKPSFGLNSFINDTLIANAHVGVFVQDASTLQVMDEHQSNKLFLPASCTKIMTTYAALKNLEDSLVGIIYRIEEDSSITFKGTGDPTFLQKDFKIQNVYQFLKSKKSIKFYTEERKFNPLGSGWSWNDYEEPYMAERSILPMYGNLLTATKENDKLIIEPKYLINYSKDSLLRAARRSSPNIIKNKLLGNNEYFFEKKDFYNKSKIEIPFSPNSSLITQLLKDTLFNVDDRIISVFTPDLPKPFDKKIYSQPTDSLLKPMMHNSDNFFAEQTLLMTSMHKFGYMSDDDIIKNLLNNELKDLPQKPRWVDGSGLSRYNLFSPQDFVFVLNKMNKEMGWQRVSNLFPTGGQGTLKNFYKNYSNKIYAKTGSMGNTFTISGYLITNAGKNFTFSIMVNNFNGISTNNIRSLVEKYISSVIENN